jgi:hypothetical protein
MLAKVPNAKRINAGAMNHDGSAKFLLCPSYKSNTPGTYGLDIATNTARAVIDFNGDFAVGLP